MHRVALVEKDSRFMSTPTVSAIMPVFNGAPYVAAAIQSVVGQSWTDLELIVIDDGSTDGSLEVVRRFSDPRIRVLSNAGNKGLIFTRNRGISAATGTYIAWIDSDDLWVPGRLERQVRLMEAHPEIGLCGGWSRLFGRGKGRTLRFPAQPDVLRCELLFYNPFATSSVMLRTAVLRDHNLRFEDAWQAEDYDLWEKIAGVSAVANIPKVLSHYRLHGAQTSDLQAKSLKEGVWRIQERMLNRLGIHPNPEERAIHTAIGVDWHYEGTRGAVERTRRWLEHLAEANRHHAVFPEPSFQRALAQRWQYACLMATACGRFAWDAYFASPLAAHGTLSWATHCRFYAYAVAKYPWHRLR